MYQGILQHAQVLDELSSLQLADSSPARAWASGCIGGSQEHLLTQQQPVDLIRQQQLWRLLSALLLETGRALVLPCCPDFFF